MHYPNRPITLIVPTGPGASPDLMARGLAQTAMEHIGQPMVITNIPGGVATKGWNRLAGSVPDGYTIGAVSSGLFLSALFSQTQYHYPTALEPLVQVTAMPIMAVVRADQPWKNLQDLLEDARRRPGVLKFGHMGTGSPRWITGSLFVRTAAIDIVPVPFDSVNALAKLLNDEVQLLFSDQAEVKQYVEAGQVRVLALAAQRRLPSAPFQTAPTFNEQGVNVEFDYWFGIGTPRGIPGEIKSKLAASLQAMIHDPDFHAFMADNGMPIVYLAPSEFDMKWGGEESKLTRIIKEKGVDRLDDTPKD